MALDVAGIEEGPMVFVLALLIGIIAGLRVMVAPLAIALRARVGLLDLHGSWLTFFGYRWTPLVLAILALGEIFNDKLRTTSSRKVPTQFAVRVLMGALCGAAVGIPSGQWIVTLLLGSSGAVLGTLSGSSVRAGLARAFRKDMPAALIEDVVTLLLGAIAVFAL